MSRKATINRNQNQVNANSDMREEMLFTAGSGGFDEIEMGVADNAVELIIGMLTDISADRGAYAIRETFSNAYDATIQSGQPVKPIEINFPKHYGNDAFDGLAYQLGYAKFGSSGVPTVTIKDYGIGMTEDDVRKFYTQYGGSKKRSADDIDTIGSKGLGSKAPLAVADSFAVRTTKNGITTTAILERRAGKNFASIKTENTGKESGTEVSIPIQNARAYKQMMECVDSISAFAVGMDVLVNGEKRKTKLAENGENGYVYIGDVTFGTDDNGQPIVFPVWQSETTFPNSSMGGDVVIAFNLGGVNYLLDKPERSSYFARQYDTDTPDFIIIGKPGYLNFTPSRDEIKKDDARDEFVAAFKSAINYHDYTNSIQGYLKKKSVGERIEWIIGKYFGARFASENKIQTSTVTTGSYAYTPRRYNGVTLPTSLFVDDNGVDLSPIVCGYSIEDIKDNAGDPDYRTSRGEAQGRTRDRNIVGLLSGKAFGYATHYSEHKDKGNIWGTTDLFWTFDKSSKKKYQEEVGYPLLSDKMSNSHRTAPITLAHNIVRAQLTKKEFTRSRPFFGEDKPDYAMIITGVKSDEQLSEFLAREKALRNNLGVNNILYVFYTPKSVPTKTDIAYLSAVIPNVITMNVDDAMQKISDITSANAKAKAQARAKENEGKDIAAILNDGMSCYVAHINDASYWRTEETPRSFEDSCKYRRDDEYDFRTGKSSKDVLVFIDKKSGITNTWKSLLLAKHLGRLGEYENIVFCVDAKVQMVKQAVESGYQVAADLRTKVKTHVHSLVNECEFLTQENGQVLINSKVFSDSVNKGKISDADMKWLMLSCMYITMYAIEKEAVKCEKEQNPSAQSELMKYDMNAVFSNDNIFAAFSKFGNILSGKVRDKEIAKSITFVNDNMKTVFKGCKPYVNIRFVEDVDSDDNKIIANAAKAAQALADNTKILDRVSICMPFSENFVDIICDGYAKIINSEK